MTPMPYLTSEDTKAISSEAPTLEVLVPAGPGAEYNLVLDLSSDFDQVVGRDASADIMIPHPTISRRHARITREPDGIWLEDLGSTNGTHVNGRRLSDRYRLRDGDEVKIGNAVGVLRDRVKPSNLTERLEVVRDMTSPGGSTEPNRTVTREPEVACSLCSAAIDSDMWFCHRCGHQQRPKAVALAVPPPGPAEIARQGLIGPHGHIRSHRFRQAMRARSGGRHPLYNESFAVPPLVLRILLVSALVVAIVAAFVVFGFGVHHFVQLRQQPLGRIGTGHPHSVVPVRVPARGR